MDLLEIVFLWILYASLTATLITLMILFIKKLMKNHLDLKFRHGLWLLVILRLLIPFNPESPLSFLNLLPETPKHIMAYHNSIDSFYTLESDVLDSSQINIIKKEKISPLNPIKNQDLYKKEKVIKDKRIIPLENPSLRRIFKISSYIWFFGFSFIFLFLIRTSLVFHNKVRSFDEINDPNIIQTLYILKEKLRINKNISLYYADTIKSPFISGFINPKIYIPKDILSMVQPRDLYYILLHELIHYKRKDLFYNLVETIAFTLHWFNPIVWFAVKEMRLDRELSCDYGVLEILEEHEGTEYGLTILKLSSIISSHISKKMFPSYFYESKTQIERRIMMIKTFKRSSYKMSILVLIFFLFLSPLTLTNAQVSISDNGTNSQIKELSLGTPAHFNTLDRATDFVDFDFKVPDRELKNYIFDSINLYDGVLSIKFHVKNIVDTSGFTLMISNKDLLRDIRKNPYKTYTGMTGEKITKNSTLEPLTMGNIHGINMTTTFHYDWTEQGIRELKKNNTKDRKRIPILEHIRKDFVWEEDGIWYSLDYYDKNTSYYGDTHESKVSKEDMEMILSSLEYTKDLKNMDYISKSWENHLYIYGHKDLKKAEKIIGFVPKFPLQLPGGFTPISSSTGCPTYMDTEPWTQLITNFENKKNPDSKITFVQTQSTHRYDFLEKNAYDRETETQAHIITLDNTNIFTFEGKDRHFYIWKKDHIVYTAEFIGKSQIEKNILRALVDKDPYSH
ncbi:MAG: M56 family metallopeptidase [Anaeromicrobium sp.]|jgi:bla regulator protein BlaR1|uniref:M56 family metallopeptidase n=1 Tax=Anaeromicrobium sp. TaxID=1929132 RepID=UPI0025DC1006|nr:M56 family metallopeptidase [Anaeromicrobium sp.]MCT4594824.1 M56 family metallopeptidase [Anaeromicrobium sp.]